MISPDLMYVSLNRRHLRHNIRVLKSLCRADTALCAVVKADAYGHDITQILPELVAQEISTFAVSRTDEALWIRTHFPEARILVLCEPLNLALDAVVQHRLEPCLNSQADLDTFLRVKDVFFEQGLQVHLKLDTGMGRLGLMPKEILESIKHGLLPKHPDKSYRFGLMTHFAQSELPSSDLTLEQVNTFLKFTATFQRYYPSVEIHGNNSSAVLNGLLKTQSQLVRVGIGLYGGIADPRLQPVMGWMCKMAYVRRLPAGSGVGYGQTFRTQRATRLGLLPVGYRAGYFLGHSNSGLVDVGGYPAPVIGRVSMDMTAIDITDVPYTDRDIFKQQITLISSAIDATHPLHVVKVAERLSTHSYEVLCAVHPSIQRIWE
jgi:alanine racemase